MTIARWVAALLLLAARAGTAAAHPVHEVVQNAYLTLAPGAVQLQLELTAGPQVAARIIGALDADRDGRISPAEARAFGAGVLAQSRLAIDGHALRLRVRSIAVPPVGALRGAHGTIVLVAGARWTARGPSASLDYRNGYGPAESRCDANIFFANGGAVRYRLDRQSRSPDGRELTARLVAVPRDASGNRIP